MDDFFNRLIREGVSECFSIALSKNNRLVYSGFLGTASSTSAGSLAVNEETIFNIGSVTKPVTASLIVKLIELGEVTMNDKIKKFIPDYKFEEINIFHLLTHSAGYDETSHLPWPNDQSLAASFFEKIYAIDHLKYTPGETSTYFSNGYSILMHIIEVVTGGTLEQFARSMLFNPLGMNHSTYDTESLPAHRTVFPLDPIEGPQLQYAQVPVTGDSGLYTSSLDLIKFGNLFLNGGQSNGNGKVIFQEVSIDFMMRDCSNGRFQKTPAFWIKSGGDAYGCFGDLNSASTVGHTGFSGCMLFIDPLYQTVGAIVTNSMKLHQDWNNYKRISNILMAGAGRVVE